MRESPTHTVIESTLSPSRNKKLATSARSAMHKIPSHRSSSRLSSSQTPFFSAESALMDKETNAIYWQDVDTSNILSTSLTKPYLTQRGVVHVRATVLFLLIWLWVWGKVSRWLCASHFHYFAGDSSTSSNSRSTLSSILSSFDKLSSSNKFVQTIISGLKLILQFIVIIVHALLYLRLPPYSPRIIVATLSLYIFESFGCSTRRYLSHAMNAPKDVTAFLESLRMTEPVVKWKVRCFHYEERELWKWISNCGGGIFRMLVRVLGSGSDLDEGTIGDNTTQQDELTSKKVFDEAPPLWRTKKVITHQAVGEYKFGSCEDVTVATLWKRANFVSTLHEEAPFSKLALSKLLVLKDRKAREDYFAQQAAFVMTEGRKDVNAEFTTSIDVPGFRPKLLAVRPVPHANKISASLFRLHVYYLFTLLGLSLPYRIWFAKHCNEIRVTITKETGESGTSNEERDANEATSEAKKSWILSKLWGQSPPPLSPDTERRRAQELFRKSMQSFSLYEEGSSPDCLHEKGEPSVVPNSITQNDEIPFKPVADETSIESNDIADDIESGLRDDDATISQTHSEMNVVAGDECGDDVPEDNTTCQ